MKVTELKQKFDDFIASHSEMDAEAFPFTQYIKIENYIPIAAKLDVAQKAAAELYEEENGIRSYDTSSANIVQDLTVISLYTDLEYEEDETFEAYDMLTQMGIFDYFRDMDYEDIFRFREIFDNTLAQIVDDYNTLPNVVNKGLLRMENRIVDAINNFANKANMDPESIQQLQDSIMNIQSTMKQVEGIKAADVVEAFKE